jgi:hypothetical protein
VDEESRCDIDRSRERSGSVRRVKESREVSPMYGRSGWMPVEGGDENGVGVRVFSCES